MELSSEILSNIIVYMKYSKYLPELSRRETWQELVERNYNMHIKRYPHLKDEILENYSYVLDKKVLPSMRSLQFSGKPIELSPARQYNCAYMPMDHFLSFSELMFLLLSGCGVGYSVQENHIHKLPEIRKPLKTKRYLIGDSIEGWADAVKALVRAYLNDRPRPLFDYSDIRPQGSLLKTSGGRAPGPEPLRNCLEKIEAIFSSKEDGYKLKPIDVHDINCHLADAVLSGGIRRSSMIAIFDLDDKEMLNAKHGEWWIDNPQRALANNSAAVLRHKIDKSVFDEFWSEIKNSGSGEPGIFFTNDKDYGLNPCAEISLRPYQFCNLTTINVSDVKDQDDLNKRARAAAFIATLQAGYTDFHYLRDIWKKTTEKEALIGVSMTGIASTNILNLDLKQAANIVKEENAKVAPRIGINVAARTTTVKPEGTSSLVVGSSSGIHAWHSNYYIRRVRVLKNEPIFDFLNTYCPALLEDEAFKPDKQSIISVPIKAPDGAITRGESALSLLNRVSYVWNNWVKSGHRKGANTNNVSTTVTIKEDEWHEVGEWMWAHRDEFTALSVLPADGGSYTQAPFEDITEEEYYARIQDLVKLDMSVLSESEDGTTLKENAACFSGACEVV